MNVCKRSKTARWKGTEDQQPRVFTGKLSRNLGIQDDVYTHTCLEKTISFKILIKKISNDLNPTNQLSKFKQQESLCLSVAMQPCLRPCIMPATANVPHIYHRRPSRVIYVTVDLSSDHLWKGSVRLALYLCRYRAPKSRRENDPGGGGGRW